MVFAACNLFFFLLIKSKFKIKEEKKIAKNVLLDRVMLNTENAPVYNAKSNYRK